MKNQYQFKEEFIMTLCETEMENTLYFWHVSLQNIQNISDNIEEFAD